MKLNLRKAKIEDLTEIKTVFEQTIIETCKNDYSLNERNVWKSAVNKTEKWKNSIKKEYFIVAENEGKIVGFSSLKESNYLNLMYVHKDFTRQGIAHKMYDKLKSESIRLGVDKLTADVSKTARSFFEKKGFHVVKENVNKIENEILINYNMSE